MRVRGHATRLDLDVSHLRQPSKPILASEIRAAVPRQDQLRSAATYIAMSWFALRGFPIAFPLEPREYDLLASFSGKVQRIQVKSGTYRSSNGHWQVGVGRRPYALDRSAGKEPYDPDSIDYFFVVSGNGCLYLIPSRVLAGRLSIYADSYAQYQVGDASSLLPWDGGPAAPSAETDVELGQTLPSTGT